MGDELDALVHAIIDGKETFKSDKKYMSLGIPSVPQIRKDNTDRNRTSPFAFTGNKFEFRMIGSSQNIALANTVLNTAVADSFKLFADELEAASDFDGAVDEIIKRTLTDHARILFSGNSYSKEWEDEAKRRGLSCHKTSPEAYAHFDDDKNAELFFRFGVMSKNELRSRREIFFESYRKIKNVEARTMLEMTVRDYIPAVSSYIGKLSSDLLAQVSVLPEIKTPGRREHIERLSTLLTSTYDAYYALAEAEDRAVAIPDTEEAAFFYKDIVIPRMDTLRTCVDTMETLTARDFWPVPTYGDMTFAI